MKNNLKWLRPYIILIILVITIASIGCAMVKRGEKNHAVASIEGNTELQEVYQKAIDRTARAKEDKDNYELYIGAMFYWKTLGDATHENWFYKQAIDVAQHAQKSEMAKSALFSLNTGNIYKIMGEYDKAQEHYILATDLNSGDANMWLAYIDLYVHWMEKEPPEVLELFDRALSTLVDKTNVMTEKASYLRSIGELDQALAIYQALQLAYPNNPQYTQKITEIELHKNQAK